MTRFTIPTIRYARVEQERQAVRRLYERFNEILRKAGQRGAAWSEFLPLLHAVLSNVDTGRFQAPRDMAKWMLALLMERLLRSDDATEAEALHRRNRAPISITVGSNVHRVGVRSGRHQGPRAQGVSNE